MHEKVAPKQPVTMSKQVALNRTISRDQLKYIRTVLVQFPAAHADPHDDVACENDMVGTLG